jgi:DNA-binding response OmpR family regulator
MEDNHPILVIEDDADAVELLRLAFQKAGLKRPVRALPDGESAIAYLSGEAPYQNRKENPRPCLVMLDIKLPGKSGIEVLSWLKSQIEFRSLPVMMVTSSSTSGDIEEALRLGIRSYCVKPMVFEDLVKLARTIRRRVESSALEREDSLHQADFGR